jgi:peptidoglycan/LPS O-acetylase OafA/YrhL
MTDHNLHPKYRPDIDGLRALAVTMVVLFHAFPGRLRGGFVGVDVFFVISGYLISSIVFKGVYRNNFSFSDFYARRIRRIFPALLVVLAATIAFGWLALLPGEYELLGKHVAASAGFVENFLLWTEAGYFDPASELKELTHLWSLSVEEQFYLVYPLTIWLAWRCRLGILPALMMLFASSFLLNVFEIGRFPVATFFLPQTRLWELLAGATLAYVVVFPSLLLPRWLESASSIIGVLLVIVAAVWFRRDDAFPGWLALMPVIGSVLIIGAGPNAWLNRNFLANRYLVFVGLISYPLYLWHWPLLSFARIMQGEAPAPAARIGLVALSVLLAWLTYLVVERPLRSGQGGALKVSALTGLMFAVLLSGLGVVHIESPIVREEVAAAATGDYNHQKFFKYLHANFFECGPDFLREAAEIYIGIRRCAQSREGDQRTFAIIGDSHAEHLFVGVAEALRDTQNVVYYQYRCQPFYDQAADPNCRTVTRAIDYIASDPNINSVLIASFWVARVPIKGKNESESLAYFRHGLETTLLKLSSKKNIFIAVDIPNFPFDVASCGWRPNPLGLARLGHCTMPRSDYEDATKAYREVLLDLIKEFPSVRLLNLANFLCDDRTCSMRKDGVVMYRDPSHLSIAGSEYVGGEIAHAINPVMSK